LRDNDRRIAVTGIGMLSSLGRTREESWAGLVEGRCGIRDVSLFDTTGYRSHKAAQLVDYSPETHFGRRERKRLSRSDQIAILAAAEALSDSGLLESGLERQRVGVLLGAGTADLFRNEEYYAEVLERGLRRAYPSKILNHFSSTPTDAVASRFGLGGLKACLVSACSSGTVAIGYAGDAIRAGQIDAAVCGASDTLCRLTMSGFDGLRLVDPEPCRPFDVSRKGMNIGEAAAILVLEDMARARRRGAHVYAELLGYGITCEAYHPTSPEPEGKAMAATLRAALTAARVDADAIDHVNCHGTGTLHNDRAEARGLWSVFGERTRRIPANSIKSMVGHCLGAAGAVEAAALALTLERGAIPPTIHHRETDPECNLDVVPNQAREARVNCALSLSLAFGGNDAALVMRRA
jgi:3-oxoacyl-[acyl-carrier-protein] synthase II